jgi:transposase-like protein
MITIQLHKILNVSVCWDILRSVRWENGVVCPTCSSSTIVKNGKDPIHKDNQHYHCKGCNKYFDDLSDTIFSGSQQPLHHWITVLYLMNLNVSNLQIAQELDISEDTSQAMCSIIREGIVKKSEWRPTLLYALAVKLKLTSVML